MTIFVTATPNPSVGANLEMFQSHVPAKLLRLKDMWPNIVASTVSVVC